MWLHGVHMGSHGVHVAAWGHVGWRGPAWNCMELHEAPRAAAGGCGSCVSTARAAWHLGGGLCLCPRMRQQLTPARAVHVPCSYAYTWRPPRAPGALPLVRAVPPSAAAAKVPRKLGKSLYEVRGRFADAGCQRFKAEVAEALFSQCTRAGALQAVRGRACPLPVVQWFCGRGQMVPQPLAVRGRPCGMSQVLLQLLVASGRARRAGNVSIFSIEACMQARPINAHAGICFHPPLTAR